MAVTVMPEPFVMAGARGVARDITIRQRCEILRSQLETERASFVSHWKDLNDFILPRRGRFFISDVNKGDRRSGKILDATPTLAAGTLRSGMMSGVTSPARPWFRLTTSDPELNENDAVKAYLYESNRRMELAFIRSNLYNALPIVYGDMGVFGTAALLMEEDAEHVFRFYTFPIGSYAIANDAALRVRTFVRSFRLSVQAVVDKWGAIDERTGRPNFADGRGTTISVTVQNLWNRGAKAAWIDIVHVVRQNLAYDGEKISAKYKRFESIYYELGAPNQPVDSASMGLLEHSGYDEFPIFCPRWEVNSEDVYATNCPGMTALGDVRELMTRTRRSAQAQEKMLNPPLVGPTTLRQAKPSLLPGDITYHDTREGVPGLRPVHEVDFAAAFGPLEEVSKQVRERIERAFFADLFLMMAQSDRREITAREIDERHEEKLLALGPVLEQLNQDLLDPLIERAYNIMARKGLLPEPPEELHGVPLRVDYISIMAQAQKMVGLAALERTAGFVGQVAQFDPSILDNIDTDELIQTYADATGIAPKILRGKDDVAAMRQARQKQAAQQQAAENAPKVAGAVQSLSQAPTDGNNVLAQLVGKANARKTLAATAGPAPMPS